MQRNRLDPPARSATRPIFWAFLALSVLLKTATAGDSSHDSAPEAAATTTVSQLAS